jgi:MFS family permease
MSRPSRSLLAVGVALALADASVVTLALPELLNELDTTVEGVAAVIGVYTLVLAAALPLAESIRRRSGTRKTGVAGFALFAAASVACGLAPELATLLVARSAQAAGAAAALVAGFDAIGAGREHPSRLWTAASVFGIAIGPALGGAITQLLDWRAIFLSQAPIGAAAAIASVRAGRRAVTAGGATERPPGRLSPAPAVALALLSAALTGVLFLLVLQLVAGWSLEPLAAAALVSILPAAAVAGSRIPGDDQTRAATGALLVGTGILMLASVPGAKTAWIVLPQILAGIGMGMALQALAGGLLPERTAAEAARLLAVRHWGITLALVVLAPVTAAALDRAIDDARERSAAAVLDAELDPRTKLDLVGPITGSIDPEDPRGQLENALDETRRRFANDPEERAAYDDMAGRLDGTLVRAVDDAFRPAFLITGALAVLAAALLAWPLLRGAHGALPQQATAIALAAAIALPIGQAMIAPAAAPARGEIKNPCDDRDLPSTGGIGGFLQDAGLIALDRAACEFGSSREELALAIADPEAAEEYEREYGVDPRSATDLLRGVLP